jgi:hypothetical protein
MGFRGLAAAAQVASFRADPGQRPPTTPGVGDVEFAAFANGTDPTAAPGLAWVNQGASTGIIRAGHLFLAVPAAAGIRALVKAVPGVGNFSVATRTGTTVLALAPQSVQLVMLWGTVAVPTAIETVGFYSAGVAQLTVNWTQWNPATFLAVLDRVASPNPSPYGFGTYFIIEWDGANLIYSISPIGIAGSFFIAGTVALGLGRPNFVGLGGAGIPGGGPLADFEFLRFGWLGSDFNPLVDI